jgi:hypothetical protein
MDMRFGTWNIRILYRSGSMIIVARKLAKHNLHLVEVQEVRLDKDGTEVADNYIFFYGNASHHLRTGFSIHRESYQQLRWQSLLVIGCCI